MAKELIKKTNNAPVPTTGAQAQQIAIVNELEATLSEIGCELTSYGKKCAVNSIAGAVTFLKSQDKSLKDINSTLFKLSVQSCAVLELNYASVPSEVYFDLRGDVLTIKTQGAGNEKLIRKYGVGIKANTGLHNAWIVREGDEFAYPTFDGLKMTPPKWTPKSFDKKAIMVVYPIEKIDGSTEYLIATREGVKPNIIAQIRQNSLYAFNKKDANGKTVYNQYTHKPLVDEEKRDRFYAELDKAAETLSVDELIKDPRFIDYINPTYTSGGSREQMIIRKMKNNALKNYPKEYDNAYKTALVENLYEDNDDSIKQPKKYVEDVDITAKVDAELEEEPSDANAPKDFQVDENGVIQKDAEVKDTKVDDESTEETKQESVEQETSTSASEVEDYGF